MYAIGWIILGWIGYLCCNAFHTRIGFEYVIPDFAIIIVAFIALRRNMLALVWVTFCLGYIAGRQALAPTGLHESAMTLAGLSIYFALGHLTLDNRFFFAFLSGVAVITYHLFLFSISWSFAEYTHFSSWATAMLFPAGLATAGFALLGYPFLRWIDYRISSEAQEVFLSWR
ncbi:MAG: hypothetical protein QGI45_17035 [Myxococcota bacterium]|jgi:hypothetical protein|nr:hypothetical protein [Myxococcota bacterium]